MATVKDLLKTLIPPIVLSVFRMLKTRNTINAENESLILWAGDYHLWAEAEAKCTGYDSSNILETCKISLLKVKKGQEVYERDTVLFDEIQYSWGLLAGLQRAALENDGKLCVLDFGGSLGSTYYQNKEFLNNLEDLKWCIVEQPHFVDCGKEYFENEHLFFFHTVHECMKKFKPNVLLLSGVLQYLQNPYEWIAKFDSLKIPYIIFDRTGFVDLDRDLLTVQNVPEDIYKASYPCWFFNEIKLLKKLNGYSSLASFDSICDGSITINSVFKANWKGHILRVNL